MSHSCPTCSERFEGLSEHLGQVPSHRPELSEAQLEVVRYLLLVGCERREHTNHPVIVAYSRDREFLEELRDRLGWAANDTHVYRSAEYVANNIASLGVNVEPEDCRAVYGLGTRPLPVLDDLEEASDVEELTPRLIRWLIAVCGRYVGCPPFEAVHLNTRGLDVSAEHLRWLLTEHGIEVGAPANDEFHIEAKEEGVIAIPTPGLNSIRSNFGLSIEPNEDDRAHVVENTTTIEEAMAE